MLTHGDGGTLIAVEDVPALTLAKAAVLVLGGISVIGMDLDGQVAIGVDDLDEEREAVAGESAEELAVVTP
jgi:hypothetical protein